MAHSRSAQHLMEDERDSAGIPRSAGSDASDPRSGFKPSVKLGARMKKLEKWRIHPSSVRDPVDPLIFHGGHATVSKAFLLGHEDEHWSDREFAWWTEFVAVKKARVGDNKDLNRVLGLALRETEFLVALSHPNIIKLRGLVEDLSKDIIWLVFPWAENGNLKDFVASHDWEIPERISLIKDVAKGLDYLHNQEVPVCHGDLKSFNILVNSNHAAVITDFGSARRLTVHDLNRQPGLVQNQPPPIQAIFSTLSKTITLTGNIYTLRWAAPELLNDDQMSLWSDIWALGWITYEVLTNSIPFQDVPKDATVIERVIKGDLPSLGEHARVMLFQNLCSLMTMCWNSNPSERPTATEYARAISDMPMVVPYLASPRKLSSEALMQRGGKGWESGDSAMAFTCFTEAHRISTKIGDREGKASALCGLAELRGARKEYSEAFELYSEALKILTDMGSRRGRAFALQGLAEVQRRARKEYSEAIGPHSEAPQIPTDHGDMQGRISTLCDLAKLCGARKEYSDAVELSSEAPTVYTETGNMQGKASALQGRKGLSQVIGLHSSAQQIRTAFPDRRRRASALCGLAEVRGARNEYSEAIELYSEALKIHTDMGDIHGRASALWSLAETHRLRNEYNEAIALRSEGPKTRIDIYDRRGRADALWRLAEVHRIRNNYSEAIMHNSEALQIYTDIGDRNGQASVLSSLAQVHQLQNEYRSASKLYSEALQIYTDIGDTNGQASALSSLAQVHQLQNEYDKAIKLYHKALQICPIDDRRSIADARRGLAELYRLRDKLTGA